MKQTRLCQQTHCIPRNCHQTKVLAQDSKERKVWLEGGRYCSLSPGGLAPCMSCTEKTDKVPYSRPLTALRWEYLLEERLQIYCTHSKKWHQVWNLNAKTTFNFFSACWRNINFSSLIMIIEISINSLHCWTINCNMLSGRDLFRATKDTFGTAHSSVLFSGAVPEQTHIQKNLNNVEQLDAIFVLT